ncbi:unnamed protein product [Hymenolepis diminuta]|uniref:Uncharacterized protein n=1 Tax=Hymenolepis diminuta TaxID=6216 RepID=A0A564YBS5_HYMDI|nr:unnamed protein product [Hymenolepis diminuta]
MALKSPTTGTTINDLTQVFVTPGMLTMILSGISPVYHSPNISFFSLPLTPKIMRSDSLAPFKSKGKEIREVIRNSLHSGMLDNVNIDIRTQVYHHKYLRSRQNAVSSTSKPGPTKINLDTRDLPPL